LKWIPTPPLLPGFIQQSFNLKQFHTSPCSQPQHTPGASPNEHHWPSSLTNPKRQQLSPASRHAARSPGAAEGREWAQHHPQPPLRSFFLSFILFFLFHSGSATFGCTLQRYPHVLQRPSDLHPQHRQRWGQRTWANKQPDQLICTSSRHKTPVLVPQPTKPSNSLLLLALGSVSPAPRGAWQADKMGTESQIHHQRHLTEAGSARVTLPRLFDLTRPCRKQLKENEIMQVYNNVAGSTVTGSSCN